MQASCSRVAENFSDYINYQLDSAIMIMGTPSSGKSSICELGKAFVAGQRNQQLEFDDSKAIKIYNLPGVISDNAYKVQTTMPQVYNLNNKKEETQETFIDVPSSCLPPFAETHKKMWSILESKIQGTLLFLPVKKVSIIFVIEQKHTRTPTILRSILANFVDIFSDDIKKDFFDSTVIVISKSPDLKKDKQDLLFKKFEGCNKKINDSKTQKINMWLQSVKKRDAFLFFKKFTSEENAKKDIEELFERFSKVDKYEIKKQDVKMVSQFQNELKDDAINFFELFQKILDKIIRALLDISEGYIQNQQSYTQAMETIGLEIFGNKQEKEDNKSEKQKFEAKLPNLMDILNICQKLQKINEELSNENEECLQKIIKVLCQAGILSENEDLTKFLKGISILNTKLRKIDESFPWKYHNLIEIIGKSEQIKKNKELLSSILENFDQKNTAKEYYKNIKQMIYYLMNEQEKQQNLQAERILVKVSMSICALQEYRSKALKELLELHDVLESSRTMRSMLRDVLQKIADILIQLNKLPKAISLYFKSGNPYTAIQKMQEKFKDQGRIKEYKIVDFLPYLQFMQDSGLYEQSYRFCIFLGSVFKEEGERDYLKEFLQKPPGPPSSDFFTYFIKQEVSSLQTQQIRNFHKIANDLKQNQDRDS